MRAFRACAALLLLASAPAWNIINVAAALDFGIQRDLAHETAASTTVDSINSFKDQNHLSEAAQAVGSISLRGTDRDETASRSLQQASEAVTVVSTVEELKAAMGNGASHIVLAEHLDLSEGGDAPSFHLGKHDAAVKSIRGNCTTPPPPSMTPPAGFAPLRPMLEGQCLMVSEAGILRIVGTQVWLDNLYIRLRNPDINFKQFIAQRDPTAELYMTRVTMQGDGGQTRDCENCGLALGFEASMYAQDCLFTDFGGARTALINNAKASYVDTVFQRNTIYPNALGAGIIEAEGPADSGFETSVWLEGCTFAATTPSGSASMLVDNRDTEPRSATFYSDSTTVKVCSYEGTDESIVPDCVSSNPLPLGDKTGALSLDGDFMTGVFEELALTAEDLLPLPAPQEPLTTQDTTTTDTSPTNTTTDSTASAPSPADADGAGSSGTAMEPHTDAESPQDSVQIDPSNPDETVAAAPTEVTETRSSSTSNTGLIAGLAAAATIAILAVLAGLFVLGRRRKVQNSQYDLHSVSYANMDPPAPPSHFKDAVAHEIQAQQHMHAGHAYPTALPADTQVSVSSTRASPSASDSKLRHSTQASNRSTHNNFPLSRFAPRMFTPRTSQASTNGNTISSSGAAGLGSQYTPPLHGSIPGGPSMDSHNLSSSYGGTPGLGPESLALGATKNSSGHGVDPALKSSVNSHLSAQKPGSGEYCPIAQVPTVDSITNYESTAADVLSSAYASKPSKDAPISEWRDHLGVQLDLLLGKTVEDHLMVLPGHENRLMGGQAVVQIVEDVRTRQPLAIKFFLSHRAFEQEKSLYLDKTQPLGRFLPQLHSIAEPPDTSLRDTYGQPMPPCIIMEKGEAMDVWVDKSGDKMDMFTGLQVLSHIAERLADLHEAGYVHRDIKPGNIMWLPRTKRWTLIDFGCAAKTGNLAPTAFSLYYAAPEALKAHMTGVRTIIATEALDAWSLGVLAIELFSGKAVFDHLRPKQDTIAMILGEQPAPWEEPATARELLKPLGIFKQAVLGLIERDPANRTSIGNFRKACRSSMAATSTQT